jgi:SnoaL-like polyketide cyclase
MGGRRWVIIERIMLFADEARRIVMNIPRRIPMPVNALLAIEKRRSRLVAEETTKWLHNVNGDPRLGRTKMEIRKEIFRKEGDEGEGEGSAAGATMLSLSTVEVTIEDPPSTGMPRSFLEGLSDVELTIAHQVAHLPKVATRWDVHGTHTGTLLGRPATGEGVTVTGVTIVTFAEALDAEGKPGYTASEEWTCWDLPAVLQQIGANR